MNSMVSVWIKLAKGEKVTEKDLENALCEVCDDVHSTCDYTCPVYEIMTQKQRDRHDCPCFKNGKVMLAAIRRGGL